MRVVFCIFALLLLAGCSGTTITPGRIELTRTTETNAGGSHELRETVIHIRAATQPAEEGGR